MPKLKLTGLTKTKTRAQQGSRGSDVDEGEESYREALGRLLNVLGLELNKLIEVRQQRLMLVKSLTTYSLGEYNRRYPDRGHTIIESDPSCHASLHGGRVRRYLLDCFPFSSNGVGKRELIYNCTLKLPH